MKQFFPNYMSKFLYILVFINFLNIPLTVESKYSLVVCAMFKDEAPFLREWIEFHKLVGVEHFYLYNNLSSDDYMAILKPYIENNEVDLIQWPFYHADWLSVQCQSYNDAIIKLQGKTKWAAFLDLDEFLFSAEHTNLVDALKGYEQFGGVCANWQIYGTSKIPNIPLDKLLIEMLVYRAPNDIYRNHGVKSIIQPDRAIDCISPHYFNFKPGHFQVDTDKIPFEGPLSKDVKNNKLRINHYWCRDEHYFFNIKLPRRESLGWNDVPKLIEDAKCYNDIKDESILKFVPALKERMAAKNK